MFFTVAMHGTKFVFVCTVGVVGSAHLHFVMSELNIFTATGAIPVGGIIQSPRDEGICTGTVPDISTFTE